MPLTLLPLAAWFEGLAPLLLVAVWVVRQVLAAIQEQKEQEAAKRAAPEPNELPPKQVVPQQGGRNRDAQQADAWDDRGREPQEARQGAPQGDLRSEVDEFLKRIAQASDEAAGKQEARNTAPAEAIERRRRSLDPFEEPPRRVARKPKRRPVREPEPEIELLIDEPAQQESKPKRSQRELRHLPESQLAEQAAHLGSRISQADDRVEARLHEKFDHRLGKLRQEEESAAPVLEVTNETGAQRIKALLARPGGVREAIILSEILRRPDGSV